MVISAGEPGVDIATNLINQILVEELIPSGWEFCKVGNCYKEKYTLDRENYQGLKLTDQVLKLLERVIDTLIRQQVNINEMQFGFKTSLGM